MPKTSNIYTRVEPEIKEQAEQILSKLGIPVANAINLFLHQIVLRKGIPFEISLPQKPLLNYSMMSSEQFNTEMERGITSLNEGSIVSSKKVRKTMQRQYNV